MQATQSVDEPVSFPLEPRSSYFLKLPCELHLQVMDFLSLGTIRNLMLNRSLRPTCEKGLYTSIFLGKHPHRSRRLLKTFIIRPDLALLVRHLEFSAADGVESPGSSNSNDVPGGLRPGETNALSTARTIRSLALVGPIDWIYGPNHTGFRDAMSKMKLTHLKVELMADSARALRATLLFGNNFRYWGADHGEAIRTVLQAQPLLESLSFVGCSFSEETLENLPSHLVHSVVPRLKCLTGKPDIVAAFIGVFPGLEYLGIVECFWDEGMVTDMKRSPVTNRASISKLSVQIENPDKEFWKHFGRILALFPNTETLQLQVVIVRRIRKWSPDGQFEPGEDCFSSIKKAISPLSALRHLDLAGEMVYSMKEGTADDAQESFIAECKIACPRLESFIDHKGRLWEYKLESDEGGAGSFKHVGVVEKMEDRGPKDDLPYERDEDNDEDEGEGEDDGGDNDDEGEAREKDEEYEGAEDEAWG